MTASPAISVDRLVVNRGDRPVLDEVTFEVHAGEIVGLLGPNGAGKTTTLAVLSTLLAPRSGTVRIGGHDLREAPTSVRRAIGRVPQEIAVYPTLSGRENVEFFARLAGLRRAAARKAAAGALERVGLTSRADDAAAGYSGGMQRRLNLACGLIASPPVLLLDEPTVGVDPQSFESIVTALRGDAEAGAAVLYSTHQMDEAARLCGRVVLLDHGRVVAHGTPSELVASLGRSLRVDVVTDEPLRCDWLDGLQGTRVLEDREAEQSSNAVRVAIDDLDLAARVLERAEKRGTVREFRVQRPSLHDAFLALTGHATRE